MKRFSSRVLSVLLASVMLALVFVSTGCSFSCKQEKEEAERLTEFESVEYQVISAETDEVVFADNVSQLDDSQLSDIEFLDTTNRVIELFESEYSFEEGSTYIIPPNESLPFGYAFRANTVKEKDGVVRISYEEMPVEEVLEEYDFHGEMQLDMEQFIPMYDEETEIPKTASADKSAVVAKGAKLKIDTEGFLSIDLGKLAGSNLEGKVKIRVNKIDADFNLKQKLCVMNIDADCKVEVSCEFDKGIDRDILIGCIPCGIGYSGLAGAFINVYLRPKLDGSFDLTVATNVSAQFGLKNGEWVHSSDISVEDVELEAKIEGSLCVGIRAEVKAFSQTLLYCGVYGGVGFELAIAENLLQCYDINGYLLLYMELGTEGWFTNTDKNRLQISFYDKNNGSLDSIQFHYEVGNGFVDECMHLSEDTEYAATMESGIYRFYVPGQELCWSIREHEGKGLNANGSRLTLEKVNNANRQLFKLRLENEGSIIRIGTMIDQSGDGRVLDVYRGADGGTLKAGMPIDIWNVSKDTDQQFIINHVKNGLYAVALASNTELVITCTDLSEGAAMELQPYRESEYQLFGLVETPIHIGMDEQTDAPEADEPVSPSIPSTAIWDAIDGSGLLNYVSMPYDRIKSTARTLQSVVWEPDAWLSYLYSFAEIDGIELSFETYLPNADEQMDQYGQIPASYALQYLKPNDRCDGMLVYSINTFGLSDINASDIGAEIFEFMPDTGLWMAHTEHAGCDFYFVCEDSDGSISDRCAVWIVGNLPSQEEQIPNV